MHDLLGDVQNEATQETGHDGLLWGQDPEVGLSSTPNTSMEYEMQQFFSRVADIEADMHYITEKQRVLKELHEKSKTAVRSEEMKNLKEQMHETINFVCKKAHAVKAKLEGLDQENSAAQRQDGIQAGTSSERMRSTMVAGLKKRLRDSMGEFANLRRRVQEEYREMVERRVFAVTGQSATEEEIDHIIQTGDAETVFQKALLEPGRGKAVQVLAEIKERQHAVQDLEQSLLELLQIFQDMAVLVDAQSELLDNVQKQVEKSRDYIDKANKHLTIALWYQQSTRRIYCCMITCLIIVILIIILAVARPF